MAFEGPQVKWPALVAGADLSSNQFYFVKLSAAKTVVACSAVTDVPIGVLQNAPASGEAAEVCAVGMTKVSADAAISAGAVIGTSADGQAETKALGTDTTEHFAGQAITAASAAGDIITAVVNCINPPRAA